MVFIDRQGMIRGQYIGDDKFFENPEKNIRSTLETLLKEPAATQQGPRRRLPNPSKAGRAAATSCEPLPQGVSLQRNPQSRGFA